MTCPTAAAKACEALSDVIDEFDRLGMVVAAALASQSLHAADAERSTIIQLTTSSAGDGYNHHPETLSSDR